jgi:transcriptional regulator with XRE-family HTH domain
MREATLEWSWGDRVRKLRKALGRMTQSELAELIGESSAAVSSWEAGNNDARHIVEKARIIEERLGIPGLAPWLVGMGPAPDVSEWDLVTVSER